MSTKITKIGHAVVSEKGTAYGDAGDSTKKEVLVEYNYDIIERLRPDVVLRPKTAKLADESAKACEAGCLNDNIGYSQSSRNTLYNLAKVLNYNLAAVGLCNTDCSAFMSVCAIAAGARISYGTNAPTTTNMRTRFKQSDDYIVLTDTKHLTMSDYLKRGDILVKEGYHTVMVLENDGEYVDDPLPGQADTPITDIRINYIDVSISALTTTSATINIKAVERKAGVADKLLSTKAAQGYSWTYIVETLDKYKDSATAKRKPLTPAANNYDITLTGLSPGTTYSIQVAAAKNGHKTLCSSKVLFTTVAAAKPTDTKQQFNYTKSNIDKVYIKVDDEYKQAIIYSNIKG